MSETHSCADHALSAVESGPSRIMQVRSANSKKPVGTLPLTIGSNLLRSVVEKIIDLLQQVRFLAIRALQQGVGFT